LLVSYSLLAFYKHSTFRINNGLTRIDITEELAGKMEKIPGVEHISKQFKTRPAYK
jgi:hypothetical protein